MDFEEFLWASGVSEAAIELLRSSLKNITPIPQALHNRLRELLLQYIVVGGMPKVVSAFVGALDLNRAVEIQKELIRSYIDDMIKYADNRDKVRIRECFLSIPRQLVKDNKKFQYNVVKKGAIFENLVVDFLHKMGRKLYYYQNFQAVK